MSKLKYVPFVLLVLLAGIGMLYFSTLFHEYVHYHDYKDVRESFVEQELCLFNIPIENVTLNKILFGASGYYGFSYDGRDDELIQEIDKISKWTEYKAYAVSFLVMIVYFIGVFSLVLLIIKQKEAEDDIAFLEWKLQKYQNLNI